MNVRVYQTQSQADEVERLREEVEGWKRTALAMRDEAIVAAESGCPRTSVIQRLYLNAATCGEFAPREDADARQETTR